MSAPRQSGSLYTPSGLRHEKAAPLRTRDAGRPYWRCRDMRLQFQHVSEILPGRRNRSIRHLSRCWAVPHSSLLRSAADLASNASHHPSWPDRPGSEPSTRRFPPKCADCGPYPRTPGFGVVWVDNTAANREINRLREHPTRQPASHYAVLKP